MNIAFTINPLGLEGLGATLCSLTRHCKQTKELTMWFFCSDCKPFHRKSIQAILDDEAYEGTVNFIDFDAKKEFGHLRSLHGDWTSYGRLLIPDHIHSDVVLYLDSDLIVLVDVLDLTNFDFKGKILAAASGGKVKYALERDFLMTSLQIAPETDYFNAGVLLINLFQWRLDDIQNKWKSIAQAYPNELLAVDQTLLNAVCKGDFAPLSCRYNNAWCPGDEQPEDADHSILHFVGSPKPWDVLGETLHQGYETWKTYNTQNWNKEFNRLNWSKVVRTWKIKNSILIKLKAKIKQGYD